MSRFARKVDANQSLVVDALRRIGCTVVDLSRVGQGCPDLLVGFRGVSILIEVKNRDGLDRITEQQERWFSSWKGSPVHVCRSPEQAVEVVGSYGN